MSKMLNTLFVSLMAVSITPLKADSKPGAGVVNFATIISESKYGKQEQEAFDQLKKQMMSLMEDTEKQLNEISTKFSDPEYLDGLSPEGEAELKTKFQTLSEELNRYQNQYYQVMNQANMRLVQVMTTHITDASQKLGKKQKISMVINKDACFYYDPSLEITTKVIEEMDTAFEKDENAKNALNAKAQEQKVEESTKTEVK